MYLYNKSCQLFHGTWGTPQLLHDYLVRGICTQAAGFGAERSGIVVEIGPMHSFPCPFPKQVVLSASLVFLMRKKIAMPFLVDPQHTDSRGQAP